MTGGAGPFGAKDVRSGDMITGERACGEHALVRQPASLGKAPGRNRPVTA